MKYILGLFLATSLGMAKAQQIKIGDPLLPGWGVLAAGDSVNLDAYKGKWIVLNFWNQGCISCITEFPAIEKAQAEFANQLQVIMLNKEDADSTCRFFQKRPRIKRPPVPMLSGAASVWKRFSTDAVPYQVWIDTIGVVRYITEAYNLTPVHLEAVFSGERLLMRNINAGELSGTPASGSGNNLYEAAISRCDQKKGRYQFEAQPVGDSAVHMSMPCYAVADLYKIAYSEGGKYDLSTPSRVVLEIKDSFRFIRPKDLDRLDEWTANHSYTYDLVIPATEKERRYAFMQEDLVRYFGLTAKREQRKVECLVLVKTGRVGKLKSAGGTPVDALFGATLLQEGTSRERRFRNKPFKDFISHLRAWAQTEVELPFIDQTGLSGNVDITIREQSMTPFNLEEFGKDIVKYNLALIKRLQWQTVLVIKEGEHRF